MKPEKRRWKVVRITEEVYNELATRTEEPADTADTVLRRLLGLPLKGNRAKIFGSLKKNASR